MSFETDPIAKRKKNHEIKIEPQEESQNAIEVIPNSKIPLSDEPDNPSKRKLEEISKLEDLYVTVPISKDFENRLHIEEEVVSNPIKNLKSDKATKGYTGRRIYALDQLEKEEKSPDEDSEDVDVKIPRRKGYIAIPGENLKEEAVKDVAEESLDEIDVDSPEIPVKIEKVKKEVLQIQQRIEFPKKSNMVEKVSLSPIVPKITVPKYHIPAKKPVIDTMVSSDDEDSLDAMSPPVHPAKRPLRLSLDIDITPVKTDADLSPGTPIYAKPFKSPEEKLLSKIPCKFQSAMAYRNFFSKLIELEHREEKKMLDERLRTLDLKKLEHIGSCIPYLSAKLIDFTTYDDSCDILLTIPEKDSRKVFLRHDFVVGAHVSLCDNGQTPLTGKSYEGKVYEITESTIRIECKDSIPDLQNHLWRLDLTISHVAYETMLASLEEFVLASCENEDDRSNSVDFGTLNRTLINISELAHLIQGSDFSDNALTTPIFKIPSDWRNLLVERGCNESKSFAIEGALHHRVSLIQGPPGCGKTTTIVELIRLYKEGKNDHPVLATTYSNIAIDNLMDRCLQSGLKCIRLGMPEKISSHLIEFSFEVICGRDKELLAIQQKNVALDKNKIDWGLKKSERKKLNHERVARIDAMLSQYDVICVTCVGITSLSNSKLKFPFVILDEATQAIEPACLLPLLKGSRQAVLVGDHFQLPPTIHSLKAQSAGLGKSMFERFVDCGMKPFTLNIQYRMNPNISAFPSKTFYNGLLKDGVTLDDRRWIYRYQLRRNSHPVTFINYDLKLGHETHIHESFRNSVEADIITAHVQDLMQGNVPADDIGIIAMYSGQVQLLKKRVNNDRIEIKSVDGFQGREKEVIILSLVRANSQGTVGFLHDWRRMNVALTRARRGFFLVGNLETISTNREWKVYIDWLRSKDLIDDVKRINPLTFYS